MELKPTQNPNNINNQNAPMPNQIIYQNVPNQNIPYATGQAVVVQPQYVVPVASNQIYVATINNNIFKLDPVYLNCPFCRQNITTTVETSFSCLACCICMFTGLTLYLCIQLCRGKDICCQDAIHICPCCGKQLGYYKAI